MWTYQSVWLTTKCVNNNNEPEHNFTCMPIPMYTLIIIIVFLYVCVCFIHKTFFFFWIYFYCQQTKQKHEPSFASKQKNIVVSFVWIFYSNFEDWKHSLSANYRRKFAQISAKKMLKARGVRYKRNKLELCVNFLWEKFELLEIIFDTNHGSSFN